MIKSKIDNGKIAIDANFTSKRNPNQKAVCCSAEVAVSNSAKKT